MMAAKSSTVLIFLLITHQCQSEESEEKADTTHPLGDGHGKPFGQGRPSAHIPVVTKRVLGKEFFTTYVRPHKPILFKGLIKDSPALSLWSDEYFLKLKNVPEDYLVNVEIKKEDRSKSATKMRFKEFVQVYNETSQYMIEDLPPFLRDDLQVPSILQCPEIVDTALVVSNMWFSSGGSKSVVHGDVEENINCLIAGSKRFVLVDRKYKEMIAFAGKDAMYSSVDVDAVDYDKYPGLAQIDFLHADMEAGDCLYIPARWIHQVNSFSRNIAITTWWDPSMNDDIDLEDCNTEFDPNWRLSQATYKGVENLGISASTIRVEMEDTILSSPFHLDAFPEAMGWENYLEQFEGSHFMHQAKQHLRQIFDRIDFDSNGVAEKKDVEGLTADDWNAIFDEIKKFEKLGEEYEEWAEEKKNAHDEF